MSDTPAPVEVHETEEQLVTTAQEAVFQSNWIVGECAAKWTERYARGRTDADFALLVGLSADQIYQRRRVWEAFQGQRDTFPHLKWSHYYCALTWDDARECLEWAEETLSTVAEMRAWRRARRGEDLSLEALDDALQLHPQAAHVVAVPTLTGDAVTVHASPDFESTTGGERLATVAGQARETGAEGEYTPFRTGAAGPAGKAPPERPSTEQIARKITSALERFAQAMDKQFLKEFPDLPEKIQARFQRAAEDFNSAITRLP
ncbi:MAG TPA: hypothetical protein DDY91_02100 [Planctomycetaceae bacterium]|jgi:hypothetical protein|nr:hypothetical protein [Planctomycetaceae bacterium]